MKVLAIIGSFRRGSFNTQLLKAVALAPDFALASAHTAFDGADRLVDEATRGFLQKYMTGYTQWLASQ